MAIIVNPNTFNPSALTTPGLYLEVLPPLAFIPGAPASVSGITGTASWGRLNTPILVGSLNNANNSFGPISSAALTDLFDLPTEIYNALNQTAQAQGLTLWCVRVSDGTDEQASVALDAATGQVTTITVSGTITDSDVVSITFTASGIGGSPVAVTHTVTSGDTSLPVLATHLAAAITANSALATAGISATANTDVITVFAAGLTANTEPVITDTSAGGTTELLAISAPAAVLGGTLTALYSGVLGNQIVCTISAGSNANVVNVLLTAWSGKSQEFYVGLPKSAAFWAAFQSALLGGTGALQGPSQLCSLTLGSVGVPSAPALATSNLIGGTDGRSGVDKSDLIGENDTVPPTGLYTLLNLSPAVQQAWPVGLTDSTAYAELDQFAQQNGIAVLLQFPFNTSITSAITSLNSTGVVDYQAIPVLDWILWFDPVNNVQRYSPPGGIAGGFITSLAPQISPLNKELTGVLATPRTAAGAPYSFAEIGQANSNGITLITNPIPLGPTFGFATAVNRAAVTNATQSPIEYTRMTNFIINSVGSVLGQFVGQLQTPSPTDPTRAAIVSVLTAFFANLVGSNQLAGYNVICTVGNTAGNGVNTPQQIAQHICNVFVAAQYESSIWYLIFTLQGGTTVSVSSAVIAPQPA